MSTISNLIFKGANHYITSSYGARGVINTSAGKTSSFHYGTDYGTDGKKIPQYAIEDGVIIDCGRASDGAKYVWVKYPRIGKKFLHYHLDSIAVKAGQAVKRGTKLGTTGKTGKATGVHLHLAVKDLKTDKYEDPEKLVYSDGFLPARGYFTRGDKHDNIGKIAKFMRKNFPKYTPEAALGNKYGDNIIGAVKEFQRRSGLKANGDFDAYTLKELKKYGFKE